MLASSLVVMLVLGGGIPAAPPHDTNAWTTVARKKPAKPKAERPPKAPKAPKKGKKAPTVEAPVPPVVETPPPAVTPPPLPPPRPPTPPVPQGPEPLAVLPVVIHVGDLKAREGSTLLTSVLATRLAQEGTYRVISADELQELVRNENERQGMGCSDDGCLAELAGALGARRVVMGEVSSVGTGLTWSASLVDQHDGEVVRRASASGASVQALMAQADEVALALMGKVADTRLKGRKAAVRLGLEDKEDLEKFRAYREERPEVATSDAFTQFIIANNLDSNGLAVAEAIALVGGAACIVVMTGLAVAGYTASLNLRQPVLTVLVTAPIIVLGPLALGLGITGLVLSVVDAFNIGFVKVKKDGCCRDDAEIKDAASRSGLRRATALAVLLAGPVQILSQLVVILFYSSTSVLIPLLGLGYSTSAAQDPAAYTNPLYLLGLYFSSCGYGCTCCMSWMPLCVGTTVGAFLLLWPSKDPVEDLDDAPVARKAEGA